MTFRDQRGTGDPTAGPEPRPGVTAELLDADQLGAMLQVSRRTLYRLADAGRLPFGIKLGGVRRWRRSEILAWIERGCPRVDERGRA